MKELFVFLALCITSGSSFGADNRTEALKRLQTKNLVHEAQEAVESVRSRMNNILIEMSVIEDILADNFMVDIYEVDQEYEDILTVGGNIVTVTGLWALAAKMSNTSLKNIPTLMIITCYGVGLGSLSSIKLSIRDFFLEDRAKYFNKYQGQLRSELKYSFKELTKKLKEASFALEEANNRYKKINV